MIKDDKNVYYRNVHLFCERIRNLTVIKNEELIRANLSICLFDYALIWYTSKLKALNRADLRNLSFENDWIKKLKLRFKSNHSVVIDALIFERYILIDVRSDRESFNYVQQVVNHVMNVNFQNTQQHLTWAWKNLNFDLKRDISTSSKTISLTNFLHMIENKKKIWQELYIRDENRNDRNERNRRSNRQISKFNRQDSNRDDYSSFDDVYAFYFYYSSSNYYFANSAYNNQRYQYRNYDRQSNDVKNQQQQFISTSHLFAARQFLRLINENAFDFKNQNSQSNVEKFNQQREEKIRTYVIDEKDETQLKDTLSNEHDYHVENENLEYYDQNNYSKKNEMFVNFTSLVVTKISKSHCRRCKKIFSFNNELHHHLRVDCNFRIAISISSERSKSLNDIEAYSVKNIVSFTIDVTKKINNFNQFDATTSDEFTNLFIVDFTISFELTIIRFNVDSSIEINIEYEFRDWNYIKTQISLSVEITAKNVCMNTDVDVTLVDRVFFKQQVSKEVIRIMITSLKMRDLNTNRHESWKYVICDIHLKNMKDDKSTVSMLRREIHLIDNFKANMLIDNDVLDSKNVVINSIKRQAFIISTKTIIFVNIRSFKTSIQRSIHIRKITVISSQSEVAISIHHAFFSASKDFLFESIDDINLTLYAHLVNASTSTILIRNDRNQTIQIFRNFRLDRITELNFSNVFQINIENVNNVKHLIVKKFKSIHKNDWFKKLLVACVIAYIVVVAINFDFVVNLTKVEITNLIMSKSMSSIFNFSFEFLLQTSRVCEITMSNEVIIYQSDEIDSFAKIIENYSKLWKDIDFVNVFEKSWMRISLKFDWKSRVSDKTKMYSLDAKDRALIDETFDNLHVADKMCWTNEFTLFSYSMFCVWKFDVENQRKDRIVIDIRNLNVITQSNVYFLSLQSEIIMTVRDCDYIFVIDCFVFFYQWRVHLSNRHKLIVVNHRDQESFNVIVMRFKNSSVYVQRQIDRLLRQHKNYARVYVNDIVVFFRIKKKHEKHLRVVFSMLKKNNISIKLIKTFIDYLSVSLLNQKINSLDLAIVIEKLKTIVKLRFSINLRQLKSYLSLIDWMRNYIFFYVDISKLLQKRKTTLLKHDFVIDNVKRIYVFKTRLNKLFELKRVVFNTLQSILSKSFYLIHSNNKRQLFIDLDVSKKFDFEVMLYYVKNVYLKELSFEQFSSRHVIESILFLSRLLISIEIRYWSIELEIIDIVWIFKKIRHIIEIVDISTIDKIVIYTNHDAILDIINQTSLITSFIDKLNLRLVKISNYIQRFDLDIRHKFDKQHIVSNALFRLINDNVNASNHDDDELNALFIISFIEMKSKFKQRILNDYKIDANWKRISKQLNAEINNEIAANLSFCRRENDFIFRSNDFTTDDHVYEFRRLCIFHSIVQNILELIYDERHSDYVKCFEQITFFWYIRELSRYLRNYFKHCSNCQVYQIKKHASYESLQFILASTMSFHTIIIDFILTLSTFINDYDTIMSIFCKFIKRITLVLNKFTWFAVQWEKTLLNRLDTANWELLKAIIFDRDRKFLNEMWTVIFKKLKIKLFYFTVYYSQTND